MIRVVEKWVVKTDEMGEDKEVLIVGLSFIFDFFLIANRRRDLALISR